jgi:hypothetical protein
MHILIYTSDKITVINGPNSTYYVEPGSRIGITLEVTTDPKWENQMHYTWTWYEQIVDENTGETTTGKINRPQFISLKKTTFNVMGRLSHGHFVLPCPAYLFGTNTCHIRTSGTFR